MEERDLSGFEALARNIRTAVAANNLGVSASTVVSKYRVAHDAPVGRQWLELAALASRVGAAGVDAALKDAGL